MTTYTGRAHVFGNNIDTDRIIAGKYTKTLDVGRLALHVLEDEDANFSARIKPGDILVAGDNFGAGSSREQAPLAIQAAGISVVVAGYFARIFFRNAINIGLPVVEVGAHQIRTGSELMVDLGRGLVQDVTDDKQYRAAQMPAVMVEILSAGGLVNYIRHGGSYG